MSAVFGAGLVLERRPQPLPDDPRPVGGVCTPAGTTVDVPHVPGRYVYAAVDVPLSVAGRIGELVLKVPPPTIRLRLAGGGDSPDFRLVRATAPGGLLVSDYAAGAADVANLFAGHPARPVLSLVAGGRRPAYTGTTCIRFFSSAAPA